MLQPTEVKMVERSIVKGSCMKQKPALGYCVPVLKTIELLQLADVQQAVCGRTPSVDIGEMVDFEDGYLL